MRPHVAGVIEQKRAPYRCVREDNLILQLQRHVEDILLLLQAHRYYSYYQHSQSSPILCQRKLSSHIKFYFTFLIDIYSFFTSLPAVSTIRLLYTQISFHNEIRKGRLRKCFYSNSEEGPRPVPHNKKPIFELAG